MEGSKEEVVAQLRDDLNSLHEKNKVPVLVREIIEQKRWQGSPQKTAVYYGCPTHEEDMGRYNDASGRTGVCYTADFAVTACAESYGRLYHKSDTKFHIGSDELDKAHICTVRTTRKTNTIDMGKLQACLHLTSDKLTGDDQTITREIVNWAANLPCSPYDGVTYRSRHHGGNGTCTAFWNVGGRGDPLETVNMVAVSNYKDRNPECFPQGWEEDDIDGEEILTEALHCDITPNNQ